MLDGVRGAIAKINLRKMDDEEGRVCIIGIAKQRSLSQGDLNQTNVPPKVNNLLLSLILIDDYSRPGTE